MEPVWCQPLWRWGEVEEGFTNGKKIVVAPGERPGWRSQDKQTSVAGM